MTISERRVMSRAPAASSLRRMCVVTRMTFFITATGFLKTLLLIFWWM